MESAGDVELPYTRRGRSRIAESSSVDWCPAGSYTGAISERFAFQSVHCAKPTNVTVGAQTFFPVYDSRSRHSRSYLNGCSHSATSTIPRVKGGRAGVSSGRRSTLRRDRQQVEREGDRHTTPSRPSTRPCCQQASRCVQTASDMGKE